jgi:glycosyltransferase involved in cell wall biosynthesis
MNLLLLTSKFPYPPGEYFLEGELDILSELFQKVLIVPINHIPIKEVAPRHLPANIEVLTVPDGISKARRLYDAIKDQGFFRCFIQILIALIHNRFFSWNKIKRLCNNYLRAAANCSLIARCVDVSSYDIFYSYWGVNVGLHLHFMKQINRLSGAKLYISRLHRHDLYPEQSELKALPFQNMILKCCDLVAPCSEQGQSRLQIDHPDFSNKIHCHHLGVHPQEFLNQGSNDDVLRIVSCSFIVPVKRLHILVNCLKNLKRKAIWTHIGDGPNRGEIEESIKQLPVQVQAVLIGEQTNAEVLDYYRNNPVDVFVNVSSSEGIPMSIMEAMSFGVEIIATDVGGVSELVKPEFGQLLEAEFEPKELTDLLDSFKSSKERRLAAQEHQRKHFSINNYRKIFLEIISSYREKAKKTNTKDLISL